MDSIKRLGFVGIILEDRKSTSPQVNTILGEFGDSIIARTGLPYRERNCCVITLVVDITSDEIGKLTGRLGQIKGVSVKSGLAKV